MGNRILGWSRLTNSRDSSNFESVLSKITHFFSVDPKNQYRISFPFHTDYSLTVLLSIDYAHKVVYFCNFFAELQLH